MALYGLANAPDNIRMFHENAVEYFRSIGCHPDRISIDGSGFSGKTGDFKKINARFSRATPTEVASISMYSMLPNGDTPLVDWQAISFIDTSSKSCVVVAIHSSFVEMNDPSFVEFSRTCVSLLSPAYGYLFSQAKDNGPFFYAMGMNFGVPSNFKTSDSQLAISRWGDVGLEQEVYRQGVLRDVFPYNYLSEAHVSRRIGDKTFTQWVDSDSWRGTIRPINEKAWLWRVATGDEPRLSAELNDHGMIFDWRSYQ
ncbi:hypothetical protein [Planctopirus hydrillae]|uniref:Uncharacterized protein n=1 Tax=Planctopirus hydrillae TaxID=1841610 RepID=A0A1C3ETF4_9PLAN|nr:hypothetical protein [Planctopirus hydrillae]ODA36607.1 hypothetical protein A6X21_15850 [Planctopirus hydrillae]